MSKQLIWDIYDATWSFEVCCKICRSLQYSRVRRRIWRHLVSLVSSLLELSMVFLVYENINASLSVTHYVHFFQQSTIFQLLCTIKIIVLIQLSYVSSRVVKNYTDNSSQNVQSWPGRGIQVQHQSTFAISHWLGEQLNEDQKILPKIRAYNCVRFSSKDTEMRVAVCYPKIFACFSNVYRWRNEWKWLRDVKKLIDGVIYRYI